MKIARRKIRLKSINQKSEQSFESDKEPDTPYDRRKLSYANTFTNPIQRNTIKTLELLTGKLRLLRKVRQFEKMGIPVAIIKKKVLIIILNTFLIQSPLNIC